MRWGGNENIIARKGLPVPVVFADITAVPGPGAVGPRWSGVFDQSIRGFRVYGGQADGPLMHVGDELLDSSARSYIDRGVHEGTSYRYTVASVHDDGGETRSRTFTATLPPSRVALFQNHPNPFNPTTTIRFTLPERMRVRLNVYDVAGRRVATLVDGNPRDGEKEVIWDGRIDAGEPVASDIYLYRLVTRDFTGTRKMVL